MNQLAPQPAPAATPVAAATTILGQRATVQMPNGGVIRPGIRILTQAAQESDTARAIYERGCAEGKDFDTIDNEIRQAVPGLKNPLRPANVPYFVARRGDFPMPGLADMLLDKYGETRDDGVRRLYRFPVIFTADAWELVMPHTLQVWAAGKRKFWAEYDDDGVRRCKTYAAVPKDSTGRVIRLFGGRKVVDRPDFGGLCDPERCPQYQDRQCNLDARLLFIVPGLPTVNLIALPTRSFYSMNGFRQQLLHVASMRGGRLSGYLLGQQTFWITKVYRDVTRIDDNGDAVKGGAWLIELQAPIDVGSLLAHDPRRVDSEAQAAAMVLEGGVVDAGPPPSPSADRHEPQAPSGAMPDERATVKRLRGEVAAALEQYGIEVEVFKQFARDTWRSEEWGRSPEILGKAAALLTDVGPQLVRLRMLLQAMNVPTDRHALYAARRFRREHWQFHPDAVARAIREAEEHAQAPEALAARIETELDVG
ncbi:MAG TPA: hypothetical protein VD932_05380 [Aquabacterium sp.]|nr:hypothetical protein [Aquabacterium sp.]